MSSTSGGDYLPKAGKGKERRRKRESTIVVRGEATRAGFLEGKGDGGVGLFQPRLGCSRFCFGFALLGKDLALLPSCRHYCSSRMISVCVCVRAREWHSTNILKAAAGRAGCFASPPHPFHPSATMLFAFPNRGLAVCPQSRGSKRHLSVPVVSVICC